MNECIKHFIEVFPPEVNLTKPDEKILAFAKEQLPQDIIDLWTYYGFGNYGNGLIKVIDPRDYMGSLYDYLGNQDFNKIPIVMSAFGDLFYYRKLENNENDICLLDIHYQSINVCAYDYKDFFNGFIIDEEIQEHFLKKQLFREARNTFGDLDYNEIFFFVPALALGASEDVKYIKKGDAYTHQHVLLQLLSQK